MRSGRIWDRGGRAVVAAALALLAGCGVSAKRERDRIPHYGVTDLGQPRELDMVSMPPYVVEPPDELELSVRPAELELPTTTLVVQADGNLDFGFYGRIYVAGLTLDEVERKVSQHLAPLATARGIRRPVDVSARLVNGRSQSKYYYVIGTVSTQGRFPITGNDTVMDGILLAGIRSNSLPEKAYLSRPHPMGGADTVLRIDWDRIKMGDTTSNYQLMPGDRIIVPGTRAPGLLSGFFGG